MIYLANRSLPTMEAFSRESGGSVHKAGASCGRTAIVNLEKKL